MSLFDFDENPENIPLMVVLGAGLVFFIGIYCSFIHPILMCFKSLCSCCLSLCCVDRTRIYAPVSDNV